MTWKTADLGSICRLINGKAFKPSDWSEEGEPIIRIQNLNDRAKPFNYWNGSLEKEVLVKPGDLLFAWSGTPGTSFGAHIWDGPSGVLNQHIFRVDIDEAVVDKKWWAGAVNFKLKELIGQAHGGVGLKHVTKGMVDRLEIPLPPLEEQMRIAAILDQADALRRLRARALDRLNALGQAIFHEMFGERIGGETKSASLGQIAAINPTRRFSADQDFPVAFLPMSAVSEAGQIERAETRSLSEVKKGYTYFEAGDVLLAKITPCFENMKGCIFHDPDYAIGFGSTEFHVLRPTEACTSEFLLFLTRSSTFRRKGEMNMTGSAGQKRVPSSFISAFPLDTPSIAEQREFSRRVTHITAVRPKYLEAERRAAAMFASLQQRAFSGDL